MQITKTILLLLAVTHAEEQQESVGTENKDTVPAQDQEEKAKDQSQEPSDTEDKEVTQATGEQNSTDTNDQVDVQSNDNSDTQKQEITSTDENKSEETGSNDTGKSTESQEIIEKNEVDTENKEEISACPNECEANEVCATLMTVVDLEGNKLPENHPNYGAKEIQCTARTNCGTNFKDDGGNFFNAECPEEKLPENPSNESSGTGNKSDQESSEETEKDVEQDQDKADEKSEEGPLLLPTENEDQIPINAIDMINAENQRNAIQAEQAAITLAQNSVSPGHLGGSCNLIGDKCHDIDYCCGSGISELGGELDNICGNGQGANEPIQIGSISYSHMCGSIRILASLGTIASVAYMM